MRTPQICATASYKPQLLSLRYADWSFTLDADLSLSAYKTNMSPSIYAKTNEGQGLHMKSHSSKGFHRGKLDSSWR